MPCSTAWPSSSRSSPPTRTPPSESSPPTRTPRNPTRSGPEEPSFSPPLPPATTTTRAQPGPVHSSPSRSPRPLPDAHAHLRTRTDSTCTRSHRPLRVAPTCRPPCRGLGPMRPAMGLRASVTTRKQLYRPGAAPALRIGRQCRAGPNLNVDSDNSGMPLSWPDIIAASGGRQAGSSQVWPASPAQRLLAAHPARASRLPPGGPAQTSAPAFAVGSDGLGRTRKNSDGLGITRTDSE